MNVQGPKACPRAPRSDASATLPALRARHAPLRRCELWLRHFTNGSCIIVKEIRPDYILSVALVESCESWWLSSLTFIEVKDSFFTR